MLQISDIYKEYKTGSFVQKALDHVSLNLRDNEFVAILGPSGSGKTTLLNVVGGLDHYDSGDLIINGTSTKKYSARDWDAYRNHSVGFIFQSYNLIPHQTVQANVELALTISGISKRERSRRAREALQRVGLGEQTHKRPNQLSGGQMQRVAIARALVNEPDILLADEPTGALDSETSIQVMDLLQEVAKDRLVVMVTHNPELARQYATRIVELKDGHILSDTDPYVLTPEEAKVTSKKRLGKASMSFLTAMGLSFNNLRTKLWRTLLVAFAGSIGIIGIALILSLSNGMNKYIDDIQQDALSEYPIQITSSSIDFTAMEAGTAEQETEQAEVREYQILDRLFSTVAANDLGSLRKWIQTGASGIEPHTQSIEYGYNVAPLIYSIESTRARQVHPDVSFSSLGLFGDSSMFFSMGGGTTDVFRVMPENPDLYEDQYEVCAGRWPKNYDECVLVLMPGDGISDLALYALRMKDSRKLDTMISEFAEGKAISTSTSGPTSYNYEDFLGIEFRLVNRADQYSYDEDYSVWTDKSKDEDFMRQLARQGEPLQIVGVVRQKPDASSAPLAAGIGYLPSLVLHAIDQASDCEIVQAQLEDPDVDVFTGKRFDDDGEGEEEDGEEGGMPSLESLFEVDQEAFQRAFQFNPGAMNADFSGMKNMDLSGLITEKDLEKILPQVSTEQLSASLNQIKVDVSIENLQQMFEKLVNAYLVYASADTSTDYAKLPDAFRAYLGTDGARQILVSNIQAILQESGSSAINTSRLQGVVNSVMQGFTAYVRSAGLPDTQSLITQFLAGQLQAESLVSMFNNYLSSYLQTSQVQTILQQEMAGMLADLAVAGVSDERITTLTTELLAGYEAYAKENQMPETSKMQESFAAYLQTEEAGQIIREGIEKSVDTEALETQLQTALKAFIDENQKPLSQLMDLISERLGSQIASGLQQAMGSIASSLSNAFHVDADAFASAIKMNLEGEELLELISALVSNESRSYEGNLSLLGYADIEQPASVTIYPLDFDSKTAILERLDEYNSRMQENGQEEKVIRYSDLVGTMMSSVTKIINAISYALIAFVSISLIVSSIMIGVITFISVLERKKEIGILRSIGASKRNISEVFNAETFIIGALSGFIGIGITELLLIPGNYLIHSLADQPDLNAILPLENAGLLIALSILLTLIGGLIPARAAAKSDPVTALRTE